MQARITKLAKEEELAERRIKEHVRK